MPDPAHLPPAAAPSLRAAGRLALEDGAVFAGEAFGAVGKGLVVAAEVVFNTAMTGYQEALTDPSYAGQILVMTAPMIGVYGANEADIESARVQVSGFVVRRLVREPSNYRATLPLDEYLARAGRLGLSGVDTRALTRRLRVRGVMQGAITDDARISDAQLVERARSAPSMAGQNLVPLVGCSSRTGWSETLGDWLPPKGTIDEREGFTPGRRRRVLALDCGAKRNILRHLAQRGCDVVVVPHDTPAEDIQRMAKSGEADGLFISNGPGDPAAVTRTIETLRAVVGDPKSAIPTFGICLGHQLLALALGAETFKLPFGHRGANQPVHNTLTRRVEITSQNHGFAVNPDSLKKVGGEPTHINLNDGTLAGFRMPDRPVFAVQHHPEASPGPHDANYLFDCFVRMMDTRRPIDAELMGGVQSTMAAPPPVAAGVEGGQQSHASDA